MQEEYNTSDKLIIFLLIMLIIILFSFLCFISFKIVKRDYFDHQENTTIQMFKYKKPTEIVVDTSLKESEVKQIYNNSISTSDISIHSLGVGNYTDYYEKIYTDNIVSISSGLTYDQKVEIALRKMDQSKIISELNAYGTGNRTIASFDLQEEYDKTFGKDTFIANNFNNNYGSCTLVDLNYVCNVSYIWSSIGNMKLINKYDSFIQEGKTLYIYEYISYYNNYSTYFTVDRYGYNPIYDLGSYQFTETNEELERLNYRAYFKKYKHTFNLDDENNYIWTSTEPYIETNNINETYEIS